MTADVVPLFRAATPADAEARTNDAIDTAVVLGWASATLAAHKQAGDFEGDHEDQIWYLLGSLIVLCRFKGVDFDAIVASAKKELAGVEVDQTS
ncbi:hypothetical protein [Microvirga massiliensis]|uniref:hypothetical protein n=1 Tax=Microvirga massiliensis TaxID=1033741 RepID=UPI00062BBC6E|nr:hypothetical protein [Microvirga massiliensis]